MSIRAVVLDIGSVLEVNDDTLFPEPFERRHGLAPGSVDAAARAFPGDPGVGEIGMAGVRRYLPDLLERVLSGAIDPGKVFDLTLPLSEVAEGYAAMDERRAIKTLLRP